jgi:hypothetical protein
MGDPVYFAPDETLDRVTPDRRSIRIFPPFDRMAEQLGLGFEESWPRECPHYESVQQPTEN